MIQYPPTMILALRIYRYAGDCLMLYFADSQLFVATKTMRGRFMRNLAASSTRFSN